MRDSKTQLVLGLCIGLLIVSAFYLLLTFVGDGAPAIPEPDTRIYLQYARNMAQGQPYVYSPGDAPSTGSTSHLYPLLLAALYKLGATGDTFISATYMLNAFFYLAIIALVFLIVRRIDSRAVPLALFMTLLSGQFASAVLRMTDIGLFTLLALSLAVCLLYSRRWIALLLIILCSVTRPEGFIFSTAFIICGLLGLRLAGKNHEPTTDHSDRKGALFFLMYGFAGISAFLLILLFNHVLTGHAQFMSVSEKGYFKIYPFFGAIGHTLADLVTMLKGILFGLGEGSRQYYTFPLAGGLLGLSGILLHRRNDRTPLLFEYWLLLSAAAAILLIAGSEWQGVSNDRYLAWIMPFWYIFIAVGVVQLSEHFKAGRLVPVCSTVLIGFQLVSLLFVATNAYAVAVETEKEKAFSAQIRKHIPLSERFGSVDASLINFYLPDHKVYNILGITSPDFYDPGSFQQLMRFVDLLKHQPELRFENWMIRIDEATADGWLKPFIGNPELLDTDSSIAGMSLGYGVYKTDWSTLDGGDVPVLLANIEKRTLVDKLDIGYLPDERNHGYRFETRLKNLRIPLIAATAKLGEIAYSENGRVIIGSESFSVSNVKSGYPLWIALRTAYKAEISTFLGQQYVTGSKISFGDNIKLRIFVDDEEVLTPSMQIDKEGFSEILFEIPGSCIRTDHPFIKIIGDHNSFAYWFYQ